MTADYESLAEQVAAYATPAELDIALAMMNQARIRSSPIDTTQVIHLLSIGYRAGWAAAEKAIPDPVVEHAEMMAGGGMHVRKESEWTRSRWPVPEWIADMLRSGSKVFRRTVIVVEDWTEVPS